MRELEKIKDELAHQQRLKHEGKFAETASDIVKTSGFSREPKSFIAQIELIGIAAREMNDNGQPCILSILMEEVWEVAEAIRNGNSTIDEVEKELTQVAAVCVNANQGLDWVRHEIGAAGC